jgi:hypothetical protein
MEEEKNLIEAYDELSLGEKRKELGKEIAEVTIVTQKLISDIVPNYQVKSTDEYTNLFDESVDENKYLTGLYQDVIEFKDILATYLEVVTDMYYTNVE